MQSMKMTFLWLNYEKHTDFNTYDMILLEVNRSVYLSTCNFFPNKSDTV